MIDRAVHICAVNNAAVELDANDQCVADRCIAVHAVNRFRQAAHETCADGEQVENLPTFEAQILVDFGRQRGKPVFARKGAGNNEVNLDGRNACYSQRLLCCFERIL